MVLFAVNMYLWRCFRVNYPFIFGFKEFVGYREVLLLASGLSVLTLAAVLSNLDMEMDSGTKSYRTITELVPLGLVTVSLLETIIFALLRIFSTGLVSTVQTAREFNAFDFNHLLKVV